MTPEDPLLDRSAIEDAFRRLGGRLARRGIVADIYVSGGAAMALAYDARRVTRDIDAVFQPHGIVLEEARAVAEELDLPGWSGAPDQVAWAAMVRAHASDPVWVVSTSRS